MDCLNATATRARAFAPENPRRLHGQVRTPPDVARAPCIPSQVGRLCREGDRRNTGLPTDAERRPWTVAIDASVLQLAPCPMFVPRPAAAAGLPYREVP